MEIKALVAWKVATQIANAFQPMQRIERMPFETAHKRPN